MRSAAQCQPAPSSTRTACAPAATWRPISARCSDRASVLAPWQDEGGGGGARRADGAEDVGPFVAPVARAAWTGSASGPDSGQRPLLADPRLVLEPDLDRLAAGVFGQNRRYRVGEVFLNASWAASSAFG